MTETYMRQRRNPHWSWNRCATVFWRARSSQSPSNTVICLLLPGQALCT